MARIALLIETAWRPLLEEGREPAEVQDVSPWTNISVSARYGALEVEEVAEE